MYLQNTLNIYVNTSVNQQLLSNILNECDAHKDNVLKSSELKQCSRLVQPAYVLLYILRGNSGIPELFGTCGDLLAVEYASSEPLHTSLFDVRPWRWKVELAKAVLDMVVALENTPFGPLYLCDIQAKNLGVVKNTDGKIVVKTIDNDKSYLERTLKIHANFSCRKPCSTDRDCRIVSCGMPCNTTTRTCTCQPHVNNLQVSKIDWFSLFRYY